MALPERVLKLDGCSVDLRRAEARTPTGVSTLTLLEARLLAYLGDRAGTVVGGGELGEICRGAPPWEAADLDLLIHRLRRKLGAARALESVGDSGYRLRLVGSEAPIRLPPIVGREVDLESLLAMDAPTVTLVGRPGIGKTRLARALATAWSGIERFVSLRGCTTLDDVLVALASALHVAPLHGTELPGWLPQLLRRRSGALWVLDHADGCVPAIDALLGLLEQSPIAGSRFVVTCRVAPSVGALHPVGPLGPANAATLFVARADPKLDGRSPELARLVQDLEGVPLAIELVAARSSAGPLGQLRQKLARGSSPDVRRDTVEDALALTWSLLSPERRLALCRCCVFRGGFGAAAAEVVLGIGEVGATLRGFQQARLLAAIPGDRFELAAAVAAFAERRWAAEDRAATEIRHGAFFARAGTDAALEALDGIDGPARRQALSMERENLIVACQRAIAREAPVAAVTALAAWRVLASTGSLEVGRELLERAAAVPGLSPDLLVQLGVAVGEALRWEGRLVDALDRCQRALDLARSSGDRSGEALALRGLSLVRRLRGPRETARSQAEAALAIHRDLGNTGGEAIVLADLARVDPQGTEAIARYEAAATLLRSVGNRRVEGIVLGNLGTLSRDLGRLDVARTHYEAALVVHREFSDARLEARILGELGALNLEQGRIHDAFVQFDGARTIHGEHGNRVDEAHALAGLAAVYALEGRLDEARALLEDAATVHRATGDRRAEGVVIGSLAMLDHRQGRFVVARSRFEAALAIHREVGDRQAEGKALGELAWHLTEVDGPTAEPWTLITRGEALLRQSGGGSELGKVLCRRAWLEVRTGSPVVARQTWFEACRVARKRGAGPRSELGRAITELSDLLARDAPPLRRD